MKKISLLLISCLLMFILSGYGITAVERDQDSRKNPLPEAVKAIIDRSCMDCHSNASRNIMAKTALNFDGWGEIEGKKKISKMEKIGELVLKGKMPPANYLTRVPGKKLSLEEVDILQKWTKGNPAE